MKMIQIPDNLHDVFGEQQSVFEIACTILFACAGTTFIYVVSGFSLTDWQSIVAFIIIADVLAGCVANFSYGTNHFYAKRSKNRLIFIAIHLHLVAIAWLLSTPLLNALIIWAFTIAGALVVNHLATKRLQIFVAANLLCYGLFLLLWLEMPLWLSLVSVFFMLKVMFSFAVDHYGHHS